MEEPAQQAAKKATAKPKAAAVKQSPDEVDTAKAEAKKAKKLRQKAKKQLGQAASTEQQPATKASAAQPHPVPQASAQQQQQQQSSDGAKPKHQQPPQQLHVANGPAAGPAAEASQSPSSPLTSCTDAQPRHLGVDSALSKQAGAAGDVAVHADALPDPVSSGLAAKVAAAARAWGAKVHGDEGAAASVTADAKAHGGQSAESPKGTSTNVAALTPQVSQPLSTLR